MRRLLLALVCVLAVLTVPLLAGNAHFVKLPSIDDQGDTVFVSGRVAGLGNVPQIHVEVSGDAACVNRGGNKPSAENKQTFGVAGDFPVQNGKADFQLALVAEFQPDCAPPMSVVWSNVQIVVTAEDGTRLTFP